LETYIIFLYFIIFGLSTHTHTHTHTQKTDTISHGTHVASLAGGVIYGVAKGITLHDVRIRDESNNLRWTYVSMVLHSSNIDS
jgi:hypothetical protein